MAESKSEQNISASGVFEEIAPKDIELMFVKPGTDVNSLHGRMEKLVRQSQQIICDHVTRIEGENRWVETVRRAPNGSGGIARALQDGKVFEKCGVNISVTESKLSLERLKTMSADHDTLKKQLEAHSSAPTEDATFAAFSISLIMHPHSPCVPTVHANYRYFEVYMPDGAVVWWFGGGSDLTPTYVNDQDATHFHNTLKSTLDKFDKELYPKYKKWCDIYFTNPFRAESRGVGGVFFDDVSGADPEPIFAFVSALAESFPRSYFPLVYKHMDESFNDQQKRFQQLRRGRYVEFNLLQDRGTKFGLDPSNPARTDQILVSLPLTARFEANYKPEAGSPEENTLAILRQPKEWATV